MEVDTGASHTLMSVKLPADVAKEEPITSPINWGPTQSNPLWCVDAAMYAITEASLEDASVDSAGRWSHLTG